MKKPKKKKKRGPSGGGESMEMQKMLNTRYGKKGQKITLGQ
jgi:hypothetical protein